MSIARKKNLSIIFDLDYRPYTWISKNEASAIYLKAANECDVIVGNDEEFGIMAENYEDGYNLAKKLSKRFKDIRV